MQKYVPMLLVAAAILLSGCAEALTGCKDSDPLLFFSPVRDFACPEEPTDAVKNIQVTQDPANEIVLAWDNPAQLDLRRIELRWTKITEPIPALQTIGSVEGAIDTADPADGIPNGIVRIPNARPNERMRQSFIVEPGFAYRFRIAGIDSNDNVSLVQQRYYLTAPTNVSAQLRTDGRARVLLAWTAIRGATEYYVYRAAGGGSMPNRLTPTIPARITGDSYVDYLGDETFRFTYSIRAVVSSTVGESSVAVRASVGDPPAIPRELNAAAADGSVRLTWTAPTGGVTVSGYHIYRAVGGGALTLLPTTPDTLPATTRTYTDSGLTNGTDYRYAVRAVNVSGVESADSNIDTATPLAPPNAPTALMADGGNGAVTLSWSALASGTAVAQYYIYRTEGTGSAERLTTSAMITVTTYSDNSAENDTEYTYTVRAVNANGTESADSNTDTATPRAPAGMPNSLDAVAGNTSVTLTWTAPTSGGTVSGYRIYRAVGGGALTRLRTTPETLPATTRTYSDSGLINGTAYRYTVRAVNANGAEGADSPSASATPRSVDSDGDTLIDIRNLDMLAHIRHNLAGTSYKSSAGGIGLQCGTDGTTACTGYELLRDLDFAVAGSYASGSVNMAWRPTSGGSVVAPGSASNVGWQPIGDNTTRFTTLFEGNGYTIRNLYSRDMTSSRSEGGIGLFGYLGRGGTLRNLLIENGNLYGGGRRDYVGMAAGLNNAGTIANVAVRGGSVHGGDGDDLIGGLVGWSSNGTIVASSSAADVYGDGGTGDNVGGLVGFLNFNTITASYASGIVDGGTGNSDRVGGLVGNNSGGSPIRASYAVSNVNANVGNNEDVGGLVGAQSYGSITASYASGSVDGGAGTGDRVGRLIGRTISVPVTASYGFGTTSGGETAGNNGSSRPGSGVTMANQLNAPGSASNAAPAQWNQAASHTMGAWDFGTNAQVPALRYADYDGTGGTDYCALFSNIPGTSTAISCGTTLLPGQR